MGPLGKWSRRVQAEFSGSGGTHFLMMVNKWIGRAARTCGMPLNWTTVQVSFGCTSAWVGRSELPSYALWLVFGVEGQASLSIGSQDGPEEYRIDGEGSGSALMWSPRLNAIFRPACRCQFSVVAYQHGSRGHLLKLD